MVFTLTEHPRWQGSASEAARWEEQMSVVDPVSQSVPFLKKCVHLWKRRPWGRVKVASLLSWPSGVLRSHVDSLGVIKGAEHVWRGRHVAAVLEAVVGCAFRWHGLAWGPPQQVEPALLQNIPPHTQCIRMSFPLTLDFPSFGPFLVSLASSGTSSPQSAGSPPPLVLDTDRSLIGSKAPSLRCCRVKLQVSECS